MRPFLDARCGHEQASHDRRAEIAGGGHEAAGHAAHGHEALREAARVRLDGDRRHPAAHEDGHQRMTALVDPGGEELERIEEELRPRREADDQRNRDRHPQPVVDARAPRDSDTSPAARARRGACRRATRTPPPSQHPRVRCTRALPRPRCASRTALRAETNAAAGRVDLEDDDLDVGADGKRLGDICLPGDAGLARRDEPGAPRGEEHEHAELLVTLDLSREARARRDPRDAGAAPSGPRASLRERARRRSASSRGRCSGSRTRPSSPAPTDRDHPSARPVGANVEACASPSTPGSSSTNAPNSARRVTRPVRTWPTSYVAWTLDHGSAVSCFNPREIFCVPSSTRSTLTVISSPGVTTCDGSDTRDHPISDTCSKPCTPPPRSTNAPNSRTEATRPVITAPATIDRRTSPALARCSSSSSARRETTRFLPPSLYSMIRNCVDAALRAPPDRCRGLDVDLRDRAEGALAGDAHFVAALDRLFDLAFDRQTGAERVFELPRGRGPARQLPGERQPARGRHHHRLDAVADGDLERAVVILQLGDFDRGLALAADVDERHLRADRDDRALDGLAPLEALRFDRRLEHRGEIFVGLAHGMLLRMGVFVGRAVSHPLVTASSARSSMMPSPHEQNRRLQRACASRPGPGALPAPEGSRSAPRPPRPSATVAWACSSKPTAARPTCSSSSRWPRPCNTI